MRRAAFGVLGLMMAASVHCGDDDGGGAGSGSTSSAAAGGQTSSSSAGSGGAGGATALRAEDYCETIVDFFCDFYLRCGRMNVATVDECRPRFLDSCNGRFESRYVDLEGAGLLSLDADGVAACEAHLDSVACEQQIYELDGPCAGIWRGHQPAGQSCAFDVEVFVCDPTSECVLGLDLCGECRALVPLGGDCSAAPSSCGKAAFCDNGSCRARTKNGEACGANDRCMTGSGCVGGVCTGPSFVGLGDSCDNDRRCPYLTACIGGVCSATAALGDACSSSVECESDLCGTGGTCESQRANGQPCADNGECQSGLCEAGACRALPSDCISG
jgi:hypothetical protein